MPRFEKSPAEVGQIVDRMLERYHPQLRDAGLKVETLFAFPLTDENGDSTGPALKHHGYPVNAIVRILNLKDRTKGLADAEIVIDGEQWPTWSDAEKDALIDHELEHLEIKTDKDGLVVRDDLERPKLRIRKHDHEFGWFDSIARRHGKASFEVQDYQRFQEAHRQQWLPFMDAPDQSPVQTVAEQNTAEAAKDSGGIESVTISSPGHGSVTLSRDQSKKAMRTIRTAVSGGKGKSIKRAPKASRSSGRRMAASKR